jgi:hypothetical protein
VHQTLLFSKTVGRALNNTTAITRIYFACSKAFTKVLKKEDDGLIQFRSPKWLSNQKHSWPKYKRALSKHNFKQINNSTGMQTYSWPNTGAKIPQINFFREVKHQR